MRKLNRRQSILWRAIRRKPRVAPCDRRVPGKFTEVVFGSGQVSAYLDGVKLEKVVLCIASSDVREFTIPATRVVRGCGTLTMTGEIVFGRKEVSDD